MEDWFVALSLINSLDELGENEIEMRIKFLLDCQSKAGEGGEGGNSDFEVLVLELPDQASDDWCRHVLNHPTSTLLPYK